MGLLEKIALFVLLSVPSLIIAGTAFQAAGGGAPLDPSLVQWIAIAQIAFIAGFVYQNRESLSLFG